MALIKIISKTLKTSENVKTHKNTEIKEQKCDQCEYYATLKSTLDHHKKAIHDKTQDLPCDQCKYSTNWNGNLEQHKKGIHDQIRNVKCDHGYSVTNEGNKNMNRKTVIECYKCSNANITKRD